MALVKLFKINTLEGITISFSFDCKDIVEQFRLHIKQPTMYSILYKCKIFIYANDANTTIESLMMLTNEDMLTLDTIQCHLTLNFGFPRNRQGKLLIPEAKQEQIEHTYTNEAIHLLCPISLQTIQYPVKLNGHFYDLDAIAAYLANGFKDQIVPKCPMNIDIPDELTLCILKHHYITSKNKFMTFSISSMQSCLYPMTKQWQQEYNTLIHAQ